MTEPVSTDEPLDSEPRVPDFPPTSAALPTTSSKRPERSRRGPLGTLGIGVLVTALGFGGGVAGFVAADAWMTEDGAERTESVARDAASVLRTTATPDKGQSTDSTGGAAFSPTDIYKAVSPAVVHISTRTTTSGTGFFGLDQQESEGTGSGFVIDADGYIVTNAHVVEGANELSVTFGTEGEQIPAKVIGEDPSTDIAVIKIDPQDDGLKGELRTVGFGDSGKLKVGEPVVAIGNPFGLDRTLTTGVVSALQREIPALNDFAIGGVIQTDAAVNPGNSGGPLINSAGDVIGVNSQIQSRGGGFDGVAFAVPSETVERVVKQLIDTGEVKYAWLGVSGGELTEELVKELDLPVDSGVIIGSVTSGSPADRAGLQGGSEQSGLGGGSAPRGGDVILSFDGKDVTTMREVAEIVDAKQPGDKIKVEVLRDGKKVAVTVTLGNRPTESSTPRQ